jgi:hypothetical protein
MNLESAIYEAFGVSSRSRSIPSRPGFTKPASRGNYCIFCGSGKTSRLGS